MVDSMYVNQFLPVKDVSSANMQAIYMNRELLRLITESDAETMKQSQGRVQNFYQEYTKLWEKYVVV